jgi:hypothetical protein
VATVADLGARVLRRLGVSLVPQALRPADTAPVTAADVAAMVLRDRGIPVAEADRSAPAPPVGLADVGRAALRQLGIGPASSEAGGIVAQADIAARALRMVGVNPADNAAAQPEQSYSSAVIGTRALVRLGVIASDETPSATDLLAAQQGVYAVHQRLAGLDYVSWGVDAVPDHAADQYVVMTVSMIAADFGKPSSLETYQAAEEMLRQAALRGVVAQARAMAKVAAVHAELAGSGWIDWTLTAIPTGASEDYAVMAAQLLAPTYGISSAPDLYSAAQLRVRRVALAGTLGTAIASDKAQAVHDSLNAQGIVSWASSAIPMAHRDDYAAMVAVLVANYVGFPRDAQTREADQAAWDAAENRVRKASMIRGMQDRALAKVEAVTSELTTSGIASWGSDAIPASMADAYAAAATALMGAEDGKVDMAAAQASYQRIKLLAMNGPAGQALAEQKVRAVHYDFQADGIVQWTLLNIPRFAEEPYVWLAAGMLAPEVGMNADPREALAARTMILRHASVPSDGRPVEAVYF